MADQQKGKTRAAILQELESIKGLLVDEEDIPVLQEVIDSAEAQLDEGESLNDEDLQELQQAYRDLLQGREELAGEEEFTAEASEFKPTASGTPVRTEVQTSLFDSEPSLPEEDADAPSAGAAENPADQTSAPGRPATQESGGATPRRAGITKATGENPFLPAHIRARLHGNRPPPLFEPLTPQPAPLKAPGKHSTAGGSVKRAQLTDELVTEFLPQIETALRARLKAMTEEQLQQLMSQDAHSPYTDLHYTDEDRD